MGIKALRSQAGLLVFFALGLPFDAINFAEIEATHAFRILLLTWRKDSDEDAEASQSEAISR